MSEANSSNLLKLFLPRLLAQQNGPENRSFLELFFLVSTLIHKDQPILTKKKVSTSQHRSEGRAGETTITTAMESPNYSLVLLRL